MLNEVKHPSNLHTVLSLLLSKPLSQQNLKGFFAKSGSE